MAEVQLSALKKRFGSVEVIPSLDLSIPDRSFTVLVGPSGCGKSTLLRMIAGLEDATAGAIRIGGEDVTDIDPAKRGLAMVFQSYALYPHMTVAQNIGFALKLAGRPRREINERVREAASVLQLEPLLDRKPKALSGGQRQRVAIGRAIVREPKVFLFDEPLSNLDAALRGQMRVELAELHDRLKATMIYVTHDQVEAMTMADQIVVMKDGEIQQVGAPLKLYNDPSNLFVAAFIGSPKMNLISGELAERAGGTTIGVRPEHLEIAENDPLFTGTVVHAEHLGADTIAYINDARAGRIIVRLDGATLLETGQSISLSPKPGMLKVFDGEGRNTEHLSHV
ncbi:ABC transporter ATP-binding protein [Martelella radicis]|uniref:ABC-type sugar transport system ATPase subunit n=1 Tax=Martelella radicis TaxID=1397476 RepID=A0A7W6P8E7_9HYPH|nr:ABC transporter ATP-binding protein [Martelella radicis]MBB4120610.1 ABC-type sugar transport system ATPase subunit [Martelella radicis]